MCEVKVAFHRAASLTRNHFPIINPDALGNISISCTCSLCNMSRPGAKCEAPLPARAQTEHSGFRKYQQQHNFQKLNFKKKLAVSNFSRNMDHVAKNALFKGVATVHVSTLDMTGRLLITLRCCWGFLSCTCAEVINPFVDTVGKLDRLTTLFKE